MKDKIEDIIKKSGERHDQYRQEQRERIIKKPISAYQVIQYWIALFSPKKPPLLKQDERNKLSGLLKLMKNNNCSDEEIYGFFKWTYENWGKLRKKNDFLGPKKKNELLSSPNIKQIIKFKDKLLDYYFNEDEKESESAWKMFK